MKKEYIKPEIMFEDFTLSTNIASGCEWVIDTHNSGNCGIPFGPDVIFISTVNGCTDEYGADDGEYNGYCYHVSTTGQQIFNS